MNMITGTRVCLQGDADASLIVKRFPPLVLVVEDEPDIQSMVAEHLTKAGFDVCLAQDGERALQMIRERRPAVVCLDLNLPRISGYDVCEQIRADPATKDISILITSARNSFDVRVCSLEAGADAYLIKPYGMKQLTDEVERLFALREHDLAEVQRAETLDARAACVG
jgi:DNA-binding response OmpR family regulator